ncbi:thiamine pyrophosphate TPP-binding domain-containing protein [Enterobacter cloacae]|uniref:Thiamine pyrophosphate TPP-binding domain-containing protein n=1 Tax=Enterobacter cloacae TaxID=550 RepID=A0A377LXM7_ENTCL|nr:thiamine pyrophosphate TPP-binding domain-containing protein [Enterobacter cloacae]
MQTERMTMAQALVRFLNQQYVSIDGIETPFVEAWRPFLVMATCWASARRWNRIRAICR